MVQVTRNVPTGKSKKGVGAGTVVGALLEDKKSKRALKSWVFNTGQQNYTRKQRHWLCEGCLAAQRGPSAKALIKGLFKTILYALIALVALVVIVSIVGGPSAVDDGKSEAESLAGRSVDQAVQEIPAIMYRVTGVASDDVLNIRTEPSARSPIMGSFNHRARSIEVIGVDSGSRWVLVLFGSQTGWVHGAFLEPE